MHCGNFLILLMTSVYVIETTSQRATGSTGGYMTLKISCDHVQGPLDKCTIKVCDFELATFLEKEGGSQELRFTWSLRKCCVLEMLFIPDAPRTPRICGCIWRAPQWGARNLVTAMSFRAINISGNICFMAPEMLKVTSYGGSAKRIAVFVWYLFLIMADVCIGCSNTVLTSWFLHTFVSALATPLCSRLH